MDVVVGGTVVGFRQHLLLEKISRNRCVLYFWVSQQELTFILWYIVIVHVPVAIRPLYVRRLVSAKQWINSTRSAQMAFE